MSIYTFKFYKNSIICFAVIGLLVIIGSVVFIAYYHTNEGVEDYIMLFITIPAAVMIALFPILLNYKHLTQVQINENNCVAYSFLRRKLCTVHFNEQVFYSVFYVRFAYAPPVKFIAVSNEPFSFEHNHKHISKRSFYGAYNQKKIIVFPYDEQVAALLNPEKWKQIKHN